MTSAVGPVPAGGVALRTVVAIGPVLALLATAVSGPAPRILLTLLVLSLSAGGAWRPESPALTLALALVVGWWGLAARQDLPAMVVPAAWLLLAAHLAAVLAAYGPRELPVSAALVGRWAPRAAGLALVPPLLWLLAVQVADRPRPAGLWTVGLAAAVAGCVVAAVAVRSGRPDRSGLRPGQGRGR